MRSLLLLVMSLLVASSCLQDAFGSGTPVGEVATLAGSGTRGFNDGTGVAAKFKDLVSGMSFSSDGGYLLLSDAENHKIRKVELVAGNVTTLAGGLPGMQDGTGKEAQFHSPNDVAISEDDSFALVADTENQQIRKVNLSTGAVTTAGGKVDWFPRRVAIAPGGSFALVADPDRQLLGNLSLINQVWTWGTDLNISASPRDIEISSDGHFALVAAADSRLLRVDLATLNVSEVAGSWNAPVSVALGPDSKFAVVVDADGVHRMPLAPAAAVATAEVLGSFNEPSAVAVAPSGKFAVVSEQSKYRVQHIWLSGCDVGQYHAAFACQICPTGRTSLAGSATLDKCSSCDVGKFAHPNTTISTALCASCPADQYQAEASTIKTSCDACPSGKMSLAGSGSADSCITPCAQGEYKHSNYTTLQQSGGSGSGSWDMSWDMSWDLSVFNDNNDCSKCPFGQYQEQASIKTSCVVCPEGKMAPVGSTNASDCILPCASGQRKFKTNSSCIQCSPGFFTAEQSIETRCVACPTGRYQALSNQSSCLLCMPGSATNRGTNNGSSSCTKCVAGQFSPNSTQVRARCEISSSAADLSLFLSLCVCVDAVSKPVSDI